MPPSHGIGSHRLTCGGRGRNFVVLNKFINPSPRIPIPALWHGDRGGAQNLNIMIPYKVIPRKQPGRDVVKFYATTASKQMDFDQMVQDIVNICTVTRPDVLAVLSALQERIIANLKEGKTIPLMELGTITYTLGSEGTETKDEFTADNIKAFRVHFRPATGIKKYIRREDLRFENAEPKETE